jgi:hypothetical protein
LSHKAIFSCSGQIDRLAHLKKIEDQEEGEVMSKGVQPDDLLKDARFLEYLANGLERMTDRDGDGQEDQKKRHRPFRTRRQHELVKVIRRNYSSTRISFLPSHFSRSQQNKSHARLKTHSINWTVEVDQDGVTRLLHCIPDTMDIGEFCDHDLQHYSVSIYDEAPGLRQSGWTALPHHGTLSLKDALTNIGIVEFPRFKFCKVHASHLDEQ